ncbi:MAG: hypothetical protein K5685_06585 [Bacteroidales bacterium]|nr:hypothetical protein [Bacteroidales bacterium]
MAKVKFVYPVESVHGKVEDGQYFSNRNGKNILSVYDVAKAKNHAPTDNQIAAQEKFSEAAIQARTLLADNAQKAELQALFLKSGAEGTLYGWVFKKLYAGERFPIGG